MQLALIQQSLTEEGLDGWLFFDHHVRDPLAYRVLGLSAPPAVSRRWYYLVPAAGEPRGLVHRIERSILDSLPGAKRAYSSWTEQVEGLARLLSGCRRVAMQYSPRCAIPYISMVDAGTVELVRSLGVEVASSANLIQYFEARWTPEKLQYHLEAGRRVDAIRAAAFGLIGDRLRAGAGITEFEVKQFVLERFREAGLVTDHGPIVAVNANASNPHYEPQSSTSLEIRRGDCVLLDMWAKLDTPEAVYYDITWTGCCGPQPPSQVENVFHVVRTARDRAIEFVGQAAAEQRALRGFEVDDAARAYIIEQGYGQYFTHRTGHSIGVEVHGAGANMDNFETHDERRVIPWTCFSIEPGIYLPEFGIRSEVNVFIDEEEARVTGEIQQQLVLI
jgi:Xaa-Pro aminopeptidase